MKIASAALQMESSHSKQQRHQVSESRRSWIGDRPETKTTPRVALTAPPPSVTLSETGIALQSGEASAIAESLDAAENDPRLRLIRAMIAIMTGREVSASTLRLDAPATAHPVQSTPTQPPAAQQTTGFGVEYSRHESYSETEQTHFSASGVVRTTDGRQIDFSVSLAMSRSYHEESDVSIVIGQIRKQQDPLVLNFDGAAAQLTSQRFEFDLNADGQNEDINFVAGGSGFLALDRNGDGQINDGSELFGVKSGDGFADLAALDDDRNGWIDENDAAYAQLRVWTKDSNGQDQLSTLKQADVGAIGLAHVATPFEIKEANNDLQGQIRSSGIFLHEDGDVGTIQQVDLTI